MARSSPHQRHRAEFRCAYFQFSCTFPGNVADGHAPTVTITCISFLCVFFSFHVRSVRFLQMDGASAARDEARALKSQLTEARMALANTEEALGAARAENDKLQATVGAFFEGLFSGFFWGWFR